MRKPKVIIYGTEGTGKSTLAGGAKDHYFIDCEDGLEAVEMMYPHMKASPYLSSWPQIQVELEKVRGGEIKCKTLIIDTLDWMLRRLEEHVSGASSGDANSTLNRSHGGFGNGPQVLMNYVYSQLIPLLRDINGMGISIVMLAHAERRDVMSSDGIMIESLAPKIHEKLHSNFVEWVSLVGLLQVTNDGRRVMTVSGQPGIVAKNRYHLPHQIDINDGWSSFVSQIKASTDKFKGENNGAA